MSNLQSAWSALRQHQNEIKHVHMRDWLKEDKSRPQRYKINAPFLSLDYSLHRITDQTLSLLLDLMEHSQLKEKIHALFSGQQINYTENQAALHIALRNPHRELIINGHDLQSLFHETQIKLFSYAEQIRSQAWKGITGKPIDTIVNVGIGGSLNGPQMTIQALKEFHTSDLNYHFLSGIDPFQLSDLLGNINLDTTLFIISSKSFTTLETLKNAHTIISLMTQQFGKESIKKHVIAITASQDKAIKFGIDEENILPLWPFIGGRYSIWSAIGFPLLLMIGKQHFLQFLAGAQAMDKHVVETPFAQNMPVILACLSIWYINFFHVSNHAIIPYSYRLREMVTYLQQAEMESNGKSVNLNGETIDYLTSPVILGQEGNLGQHTYHQLLHQGTHLIPVDFILLQTMQTPNNMLQKEAEERHRLLIANALGQAHALMQGRTCEEHYEALLAKTDDKTASHLAPHLSSPGNRPSSLIWLEMLTPNALGALLALYEHKIFVQSVVWNINPFDQWGVELGKELAKGITREFI